MELKNGFKQTDIGLIPQDWDQPSIADLKIEVGDGIHSTPNYESNGDYYFINGNNLTNGKVVIDDATKRISPSEFKKHGKGLKENLTILLSINGTIGNVAFYKNEPVLLGKSAAYLNVSEKCSRSYLFYALQSKSVTKQFEDGLTGSTIKNLGLGTIRQTKIPFPLKPQEQESIANTLIDTDICIESLEKLVAKKCLVKKGAMQELLTGKKRLPEFSKKWDGKYKKTDVGTIPSDWEQISLGEVFEFKNGLNKEKQFFGQGTPIVNYMDVYKNRGLEAKDIKGKVTLTTQELQNYSVKKGDVFFTRTSETVEDVGISSVMLDDIEDATFSGFVLRARPKNDLLELNFRKYCFSTTHVRKEITSKSSYTTRALTNGTSLSKVKIGTPKSTEEQYEIAKTISDMEQEILFLQEKLEKYRQLKQGMMQNLLTGKIRLV